MPTSEVYEDPRFHHLEVHNLVYRAGPVNPLNKPIDRARGLVRASSLISRESRSILYSENNLDFSHDDSLTLVAFLDDIGQPPSALPEIHNREPVKSDTLQLPHFWMFFLDVFEIVFLGDPGIIF